MAITDKNKSTIERLKELKSLYEAGILTEEEMKAEKADILGNAMTTQSPQTAKDDSNEQQTVKKAHVIEAVNNPQKRSLGHSTKVISITVVLLAAIIAIIVVCVNQCGNNIESQPFTTDSLMVGVDTATVDSVIDETTATQERHTEIRNIKEKRGNFDVDIDWPVSIADIDDVSKLQQCLTKKAFEIESNDINTCIENYFEERKQWASEYGGLDASGYISIKFKHRYGSFFIFDISNYVADSKFNNEGIGSPHGSDFSINFNNRLGRELKLSDLTKNEDKLVEAIREKAGSEIAHVESFAMLPIGIVFSWAYRPPWYECVLFDYNELDNILSNINRQLINNSEWMPCVMTGQQKEKNIRLEFERKGSQLRDCTYTDLDTNKKINMDARITSTEIVFTGKGNQRNFTITINKRNLETTATDGNKNENIYWGYGS